MIEHEGVVGEWHTDEGWGVLESDATPGGCFAHFSNLSVEGFRELHVGECVRFTVDDLDSPAQDGYSYRAIEVSRPTDGKTERADPAGPGTGYSASIAVHPDAWDAKDSPDST